MLEPRKYKVYIIHSPSNSKNYIDRTLAAERLLMEEGHEVVNPLPDQMKVIDNESLHFIHGYKMRHSDVAYAMEGWDRTDIGNAEMAEMMIHRKVITFEQKV